MKKQYDFINIIAAVIIAIGFLIIPHNYIIASWFAGISMGLFLSNLINFIYDNRIHRIEKRND